MTNKAKLYLKTNSVNDYDDYYFYLDQEDKTFKDILERVEYLLDSRYLDNDSKLDGIKVGFEIVGLTKEQHEEIEWDNDKEWEDV